MRRDGAGQCAAHTSPSAFCASCEFGRFPVRDKCLECPEFTWLPVIVTLSLCVLIPLLIWGISDVQSQTGAVKELAMTLGVIIPHLQITSWILSLNVNWPDFITQLILASKG